MLLSGVYMVLKPVEDTILVLLCKLLSGVAGDMELAGEEMSKSTKGGVGRCG